MLRPTRIAVVSAGLGAPSATRVLADQLAAATVAELGPATVVEVVELREHAHALVDNLLTGFAGPPLQAALDTIVEADAVIAVTPIFTASYSALFKALFDVLPADALAGRPVLLAATGGTERHSLALEHQLRPLFGYLRAHTVPTAVYAATADFGAAGGDRHGLAERIARAAAELATLVRALPRRPRTDEFGAAVPFAELLAAAST
jgi:FMN reductase